MLALTGSCDCALDCLIWYCSRAFAKPCNIRGHRLEHAVSEVDVVDAEEVFLVLAMYCNHHKQHEHQNGQQQKEKKGEGKHQGNQSQEGKESGAGQDATSSSIASNASPTVDTAPPTTASHRVPLQFCFSMFAAQTATHMNAVRHAV